LRTYQAGWFAKDVFAGIVLTAVLVPTGLSFAQAAGLPGVGGLYASIAALTAYALFGPSRILVLGPDNFSHPVAEYLSAEAAEQAGFVEGRSIIDGIHPDGLTTDGL
jgi:MFS superfamily sulfate permease-like transporter